MVDRVVETDVLILGGGLAGCLAAVRAREIGARVTVVDKAAIKRSGEAGRGNFFYTTYLDSGEPWDTAEVYRDWYMNVRHGLVDSQVVDKMVVPNQVPVANYLEKLGISLKDPKTGKHIRIARAWTGQVHTVLFRGENMKPILAQRVREAGANVVEGVHVTNLLTNNGRVVGATGFHVRTGDFYTFKAKAVVLALGNPQRILDTFDPSFFVTYHKPWHAGTGYALAYKAGTELANIEFVGTFLFSKGARAAQVMYEVGARLINGLGEQIVERPERPGERGFGLGLIAAAAREVNAGRGPIYLDCRHVTQQQIDAKLGETILDAPLLFEYLQQSGIELTRDLLEVRVVNGSWSATGCPKGILIDETCHSRVPGLFVVGDLATPSDACSGAFTTAYVAGPAAARYAAEAGPPQVDEAAVKEERQRVFAPLGKANGIKWLDFEKMAWRTMTEYVCQERTDLGLKSALAILGRLEADIRQLTADNLHELMRAHEAMDVVLFDRLMTAAALERTESRFGYLMGHYRLDYPQQDDANWNRTTVVVKRDGDKIAVSRRRMR